MRLVAVTPTALPESEIATLDAYESAASSSVAPAPSKRPARSETTSTNSSPASEISNAPSDARLCECHGIPMRWSPDRLRAKGGQWRCRVRERATKRRYLQSEKGFTNKRRNNARRVMIGDHYFHMAPTVEEAEAHHQRLGDMIKQFRTKQASDYKEETNGW